MTAPRRRPPLRAVVEGESKPESKTVAQAAASGDRRELLVAMRERIALTVSDAKCPPRDLASLTRRLQAIAEEIEELDIRAKEEGEDGRALLPDEAWDEEAL